MTIFCDNLFLLSSNYLKNNREINNEEKLWVKWKRLDSYNVKIKVLWLKKMFTFVVSHTLNMIDYLRLIEPIENKEKL